MGQRTELRLARQEAYLKHLAQTGSIQDAATAAEVKPATPGKWRQRYPEFAEAERQAMQDAARRLVNRLMKGQVCR